MQRFFGFISGLLVLSAFLAWPRLSSGQALYSFVDEHGVRNFTNLPPKLPVRELKVSGLAPPASVPTRLADQRPTSDYDSIIQKYASQFLLEPSLIRSMIAAESNFNERAVSPKGARGLMQLMPYTAARVGVRDVFNPVENIRGGMKHMRHLLDKFDNDLFLSLAAYNAGENLVQRIGGIPNFRETHDYIRTVTARYGKNSLPSMQKASPSAPALFRYLDQNGVLHLTNIAPVSRFDHSYTWAGPGQSRNGDRLDAPASP